MPHSRRSVWPAYLIGTLLIITGNHFLKPTQNLIYLGTPNQQYWARLLLILLWSMCWAGLGLLLTPTQSRPTRVIIWLMLASMPFLQLLLWFPARNDVTIRLSPGVYATQRAGRTLLLRLDLPDPPKPPRGADQTFTDQSIP